MLIVILKLIIERIIILLRKIRKKVNIFLFYFLDLEKIQNNVEENYINNLEKNSENLENNIENNQENYIENKQENNLEKNIVENNLENDQEIDLEKDQENNQENNLEKEQENIEEINLENIEEKSLEDKEYKEKPEDTKADISILKNEKSLSYVEKEKSEKKDSIKSIKESSKEKFTKSDITENLDNFRINYQSTAKLFNIPTACEIEEYDFIFLDLEDFINFHDSGLHLLELSDFLKIISLKNKKPRIVINFPNLLLNINLVNLELIDIIISIMALTDIFLFEKKESLGFFNLLSQMNFQKEIQEKQISDFFLKEIPHVKTGVNKIGIFMEDLQKLLIIEQKNDKINKNSEYFLNLHPRINHFNHKIVDEYRKIMSMNYSYLKAIFLGGYFSKFIYNEDQYSAFLGGVESTKRILELFKNKIDFPIDPEFYTVKLQKDKIEKDIANKKMKKKEEKFVLDCVNRTKSTIKYYNPLFDDNLNAFFSSNIIRKQLRDKNFINTNGYVLYDSEYKSLVQAPKIKKRLDTSDKEKKLLYAIKNNKDLYSIDFENFSKPINESSPTSRKLPLQPLDVNTSNLYYSKKLINLKNLTRKKLQPLYYSVSKTEKRANELNSSLTKNSKNKSDSKTKVININNYPYLINHNAEKSELNKLNVSCINDENNKNQSRIISKKNSMTDVNNTKISENKSILSISQKKNKNISQNNISQVNLTQNNLSIIKDINPMNKSKNNISQDNIENDIENVVDKKDEEENYNDNNINNIEEENEKIVENSENKNEENLEAELIENEEKEEIINDVQEEAANNEN